MRCFPLFKLKKKRQIGTERGSGHASMSTTIPTSTNATGISESSASCSTKQTSKSSASASSPRSISAMYDEKCQSLRIFDIRELRNATHDFHRLLKIGEGGFGSVYKGSLVLPGGEGDKIEVAIKKLNQNGLQGHKQWLTEVLFLGVVEHPNLVKLIGYCAVDGQRGKDRLLVYEYMCNKSLDDHLFNKAYPLLPWNKRLEIALGVAEGLKYLHEGLEVQVIYRDFKASNILLDENFKPKLSDFGLAREGPSDGRTHVTTAIVGTYGYAAPDYVRTGHLTIKSDVWSFGVVLFELLTGRRSMDRNRPLPEHRLLDWVKRFPPESKKFRRIMDPRLEEQYSLPAARLIAELANACLSKSPSDRPSMSGVVERLKHVIQVSEGSGPSSPLEEQPAATISDDEMAEEDSVSASAKRRMLHLAKLEASANAESRRKFTVMRKARQM